MLAWWEETAMLVSDIMTLNPECCTPECTAEQAARQMRQGAMGVLPVVEETETRKLVGIVTDRDLCMGVVAEGRIASEVTASDCMTRATVGCATGEPVERALQLMRERQVRRLPVVDSAGRVVGIISLTDIIRYAALPEAEGVAAVARIYEPRGVLRRSKQEVGAPVTR